MPNFFTTRQVGEMFGGEPEWMIRRIVDQLDEPVERFGSKRVITPAMLPRIAEALRDRGRLREAEVVAPA